MLSAAALAALALAAGPPGIEGSVAAGAGYDSNLNHGSRSAALGGGYAFARAAAGPSWSLGEDSSLYAGLTLDGEAFPAYSDLSTGTAGVEASLLHEISEAVALSLSPAVARSWSGDPARDATLLAARLTLRVRPLEDLSLRASYAYAHRGASASAFSYDRNGPGASAEWRLARKTWLSLSYAAEFGQEVFYRDVSGGMGGMGGHLMGTFGKPQEAYAADATSHAVGAGLETGLGGDLFLEARYGWRLVLSAAGDYRSQSAWAGVGWRY